MKIRVPDASNSARQQLGVRYQSGPLWTEHTVSNYFFRLYEKLGIPSRVELVGELVR